MTSPARSLGWWLFAATVGLAAVARWLFPLAQPTVALEQRLTPDLAAARARAFAQAHALPIAGAREAVRFDQAGDVQTYVELEAGGKPAVDAEVRGTDIALFSWEVRFFRPGDPREVRVTLAPDGRVIGFRDVLAEADARPALDSAAALAVADSVRRAWLSEPDARWRVVAASVATVAPSRRVDRTFTYERTDRRLGTAPLRLDVVVRGDRPGGASAYAKIPEAFTRRYRERRADNELYAGIASAFVPLFALFGLVAMAGIARRGGVRWRPALLAGLVMGLLLAAAQVNGITLSWFDYDTATGTGTHLLEQWLGAAAALVGMGLVSAVLLAMGEALTREAFPDHFDWWQTTAQAGTRPVALRLLGGYTVAAFGLAYVSVFYLVTHRFGWWSPSGLLDDPNQIATPLPWVTAVAVSLQAGVLEEVLFRAVPLALVARAVRDRPWRRPAMAAAVIGTALVFGFGHANYPSWPAYARGVELFLEAVLWAVLYLRVGLVTTVVGHFTYDLVLFGLFASAGTATPYRITLAVVALVASLPALLVARQAWRRRGLAAVTPDSARFSAWRAPERSPDPVTDDVPVGAATSRRFGRLGVVVAVVSVALAVMPTGERAAPSFTVTRAEAVARADSVLRTLGDDPARWTRLVDAELVGAGGARRFLRATGADSAELRRLERTWLHGGQWSVRYVRPQGSVAERAEQWMIALEADGRPHTWEHVLPDSLPARSLPRAAAESLARAALAASGADPRALVLVSAEETARPARRDVEFTFDDTGIRLPAGGAARRLAVVAGDRVVRVGHAVFIPEAWSREDTKARSRRGTISVATVFVAVLVWLVALLVVLRRAPVTGAVAWPRGGRAAALLGIAGVVAVVVGVNEWGTRLHGWDTAQPWDRHRLFVLLGLVGSALGPVVVWLLWRATDAVRARAGVPVRAPTTRDALVGGALLMLGPTLMSLIPWMLLPTTPTLADTVLDAELPWLAALFTPAAGGLATAGGAALVLGAIVAWRRAWSRGLVVLAAAVAFGLVVGSGEALTDADWLRRAAVLAASAAVGASVLWRVGAQSFEAWAVAGLLLGASGAVTSFLVAATPTDAVAHLLGLAPAVAALTWLVRRPR